MYTGADELVDGGQAHCRRRADAEPLKEARGQIASKGIGRGGTNGGNQADDGAEDEDDAPAVDVGEGRPEERTDSKTECRDPDGPIGLRIADFEASLRLWKRRHGGGDDVCEQKVPNLTATDAISTTIYLRLPSFK